MPIFRVKSVKIYTGQKKFTRVYPWDPWQIRGMRAPLCLCVIFSFPYVCAQSSEFSTLCFLSSKPKGPSARYFRFLQRTRYLESGKKPWWNLLLSWGGKFEPISMRLLSLKLQPGRNCCKCQRILQRMGLCPFFCSGVLTIWVKHGAGRARNAINQAESWAERTDGSQTLIVRLWFLIVRLWL